MKYEKGKNRQGISLDKGGDGSYHAPYPGFGCRYKDKWGEVWVRVSADLILRVSDGNLGNWYGGKGMTEIPPAVGLVDKEEIE